MRITCGHCEDCVKYKEREYYTHNDVTEAFLNGELNDNEYDRLFDIVATFLDGLEKTNPRQKHDYWGDPIVENETTVILITTEDIKNE